MNFMNPVWVTSMALRIVINSKGINTPAAKLTVALLAIFLIGLFLLAVFLVLLPLVGIAVTLSAGLLALIIVGAVVSALALLMVRVLRSAMLNFISRLKRKKQADLEIDEHASRSLDHPKLIRGSMDETSNAKDGRS